MKETEIIEKWNTLVTEYFALKKEYKRKYKDDFIIRSSTNKIRSYNSSSMLDYGEYAILAFIASTILHFIISISSSSIDFFDFSWFLFYLIFSLVSPVIYIYIKSNSKKNENNDANIIKSKLAALERLILNNPEEIRDSKKYKKLNVIRKQIDLVKEFDKRANNTIQAAEWSKTQEIIDSLDSNHADIQETANRVLRNK